MAGDYTSTHQWRRLKARVIALEPVCQLALPGICTGTSETADHIIPVADRPDLTFTRSNLRGACGACNRRRSSLPDALVARPGHDPLSVFR
ncbi:hypothetical protein GCM10022215_18150 [Nocardioides fonticola]|uniref:HNH domain-containing protein n=1 Tax=Nocardioides fonticola TaxID=450363 RepID=A0ABP7XIB6_9ACTN